MNIPTGWVATLVATVLAGGIGWYVASDEVPEPLPVGDRVRAAVDALQDSHVYVAPDSADLLTDADRERLDALAAAARPETFVIVWEGTREAGYYLGSEALRQIGAELDRPGYYVSVGRGDVSSDDVGIDGDFANADSFDEGVEITEQTVAAKITEIISESDGREFSEADTTGSDYWGGPFGTLAAGLLIGGLAGAGLAVVAVVLWFILRSRVRRRS